MYDMKEGSRLCWSRVIVQVKRVGGGGRVRVTNDAPSRSQLNSPLTFIHRVLLLVYSFFYS